MSDNVERVGAIFEAFGRGDIPFILDSLTDDVRFASYLDPIVPWSGEFVGKERVMDFFQAIGGAIEVTGHPVDAIVADGETVYSRGSSTFNVRATGKSGATTWVYVWTLRDGKVSIYEQFNDQGLADSFR
jgi:ketosteroid isomerase-like protein